MSVFFDWVLKPGLGVCRAVTGKQLARTTSFGGVPCVVVRNKTARRMMGGCFGAYFLGAMVFRSEADFRDRKVRRHEHRHYQQEAKDFLFIPKYVYYLAANGYWDNPYERDARRFASSSRRRRCRA